MFLINKTFVPAVSVALFLLFQALFFSNDAPASVTVNGSRYSLGEIRTVAAVLDSARFGVRAGDLLDIEGRVLEVRAGWAPRILVNGRAVTADFRVERGDKLEVIPALDRTEVLETEVENVVLADVVEGEGEYITVEELGTVGRKLVARGGVSGKLVSVRNLVEARPFRVARTQKKPAKVIALTFDDGPTPPYTRQIMETLSALHGTATFFVIGGQAALFPEMVRELDKGGFQVANHSYSHNRMDFAHEEDVTRELDVASATIMPLITGPMRWFRPPYGAVNDPLRVLAARRGYHTIRWHIDSRDWNGLSPEAISTRILREVRPGAVVLMHDGGGDRANTVKAVPLIVKELYKRGFTLVTLDQLAE